MNLSSVCLAPSGAGRRTHYLSGRSTLEQKPNAFGLSKKFPFETFSCSKFMGDYTRGPITVKAGAG